MHSMSSEEIIENAIALYEIPLLRYAKEITGDPDSARDVVQETFLRLSRQDAPALKTRLAPWLFCVCKNCSVDYRRKIIKMPVLPDFPHPPEESCDFDPSDEVSKREEFALIRSLVNRLSSRHRELIVLKFDSGLSYQEMSEVTGLSVTNVGVHLHAAVSKLRRMWKESSKNTNPVKSYG
jgi:RNA polymerase sigma factor (sigma-70 family)